MSEFFHFYRRDSIFYLHTSLRYNVLKIIITLLSHGNLILTRVYFFFNKDVAISENLYKCLLCNKITVNTFTGFPSTKYQKRRRRGKNEN